ncbi:MAG: PilZ domain-containing protein [Candidatus Omnitrophota bacterium]|nr:PilZ domain-containing protein [Candidatus Omnitrophota bacterium]
MDERRQEPIRFNINLKAEVLKLNDDSFPVEVRDISRRGLRLICDKFDYDINSRINMRIEEPNTDSFISLAAKVIWKRNIEGKSEAGVKLINILPESHASLLDYAYSKWINSRT